jgi:ribosomal protein L18E
MARKRGFTNHFRVDYEEVNVGKLARFEAGGEVNEQTLREARLVRGGKPVKVLGVGDITAPLTVEASSFSASAKSKIEAAGGTVKWLNGEPQPKEEKVAAEKPKRARAPRAEKAEDATDVKEEKQDSASAGDAPGGDAPGAEEREEASDGAGS